MDNDVQDAKTIAAEARTALAADPTLNEPHDIAAEVAQEQAPTQEPEEKTEPAQETRPETEPPTPPDDEHVDPEKFWNQYKDETARKKALADNKMYAARTAKRNKELEQRVKELELQGRPLPTSESKPAEQPVSDEQLLRKLADEREDVSEAVTGLGVLRQDLVSLQGKIQEAEKALTGKKGESERVKALIDHYKELLQPDPNNFELRDKLAYFQQQLSSIRSDEIVLRQDLADFRQEFSQGQAKYRSVTRNVVEILEHEKSRGSRETTEAQTQREVTEKFSSDWKTAFDRFCTENKIDKEDQEDIQQFLARDAYADPDKLGDDIYGWMNSNRRVLGLMERVQRRTSAQYGASKLKDANQPAPPPEKAKADPKRKQAEDEPTSAADEARRARDQLRESLSAR